MKVEFSKIMVIFIVFYCLSAVTAYYVAIFLDKNPEATVTVTLVMTILGAYLTYAIYQFKLKDSRNKYKIDENGEPFEIPEHSEHTENNIN